MGPGESRGKGPIVRPSRGLRCRQQVRWPGRTQAPGAPRRAPAAPRASKPQGSQARLASAHRASLSGDVLEEGREEERKVGNPHALGLGPSHHAGGLFPPLLEVSGRIVTGPLDAPRLLPMAIKTPLYPEHCCKATRQCLPRVPTLGVPVWGASPGPAGQRHLRTVFPSTWTPALGKGVGSLEVPFIRPPPSFPPIFSPSLSFLLSLLLPPPPSMVPRRCSQQSFGTVSYCSSSPGPVSVNLALPRVHTPPFLLAPS